MIGPAKVTVEGVLGHGDFPGLQSFDVVLFHEVMHAHLFQRRVTTRLRELGQKDKPPGLSGLVGIVSEPGAELEDAVEEALVVGLLGGKGVALSENAYRCQREYGLRASYKAVGIDETQDVVDAHGWDRRRAPRSRSRRAAGGRAHARPGALRRRRHVARLTRPGATRCAAGAPR